MSPMVVGWCCVGFRREAVLTDLNFVFAPGQKLRLLDDLVARFNLVEVEVAEEASVRLDSVGEVGEEGPVARVGIPIE